MIKVADLNISADNCGTYVITLTGVDATYFKVINKELYLLLDTPELCKVSYTVNVNITDLTGRLIKTRAYNLNTADCACVALNPTFGTITRGVNGFTVQITNYNPAFTWTGTATASGVVSISGTGLVTVVGVSTGTASTATITTTRVGYVSGSAQTTGQALFAALTPAFGVTTRTANGFTVQITNYNALYSWVGTPLISGSVVIDQSGLVTVSAIAPNTSSTVRITTTRIDYAGGAKDIAATSLDVALNPTFGTTTRTTTGFTVQISNYNALYTWAGTATASGRVVVSGTGLVTVTNVAPGTSVTATITATRSGYFPGSNEVTVTSSYTPSFSTPAIEKFDGFTVQITNYNALYTWAGTATASGLVSISGTGLVTVSGIAANTNSTVTITITKASTLIGSAPFTAKSLFGPLNVTFGSPIRTLDGFTVQINNYSALYTWNGTATASGLVAISGTGLVTVTGVAAGTEVTASISTVRTGYLRSDTIITESSLNAALIPTFGTPTITADGFTVQISNYNALYTWSGTATAGGVVVVSGTGLVTVTGLDVGENSVANIKTVRTNYVDGFAVVAAYSKGFLPTFYDPISKANGFTVQIRNYNAFYTWGGTATTGSVSIATGGLVTVTGVAVGTSVTVMITTKRTGYQSGSGSISATSLAAAWTPTFGATTSTADGFTVQITNYNALFFWAISGTGTITLSGSGLLTVAALPANGSTTATISTQRTGYINGSATVTGSSLAAVLTPRFGATTRTATGFTVQITNYNAAYTWAGTVTALGTVVVSSTGLVTVTGLSNGTNSTATITTTKSNTVSGSASVTESSLVAALIPTFGSTTATTDGFTVQITNYDPAYTWTGGVGAVDRAFVAINGAGLVTVTNVVGGARQEVLIITKKAGSVDGLAYVTGGSLAAALTPLFGVTSTTATADGFTIQIINYDIRYTWAGSATASGTVAISGTGLITVTGVAAGTSSKATITTTRTGYTGGSATTSSVTSLLAGLTPVFGTTTATAVGFTVQITNYNTGYTWAGTVTSGSVFFNGSSGMFTVLGLAAGTSSIVTITTRRAGYATGSATVEATSLNTALTPTFGTPTATADGFTVQIINFNALYQWSGSMGLPGVASFNFIGGQLYLTVTNLPADASQTVTITTTRTGYVGGSGRVTGTSLLGPRKPTFASTTRTADGFTVQIGNYDSSYSWAGTATFGAVVVSSTGLVTVTGVAVGTSSTVTITTTRNGNTSGSAQVTESALAAALTPTFGTTTATVTGFDFQISNYDASYLWAGAATASGRVVIYSSGLVRVIGVAAGTSSTATITTAKSNTVGGSAQVTGSALRAALTPQFWTPVKTADGFTVQITNYDRNYTWAGTVVLFQPVSPGLVVINDTGLVTVTGAAAGTTAIATITTTRAGYIGGTASVNQLALFAKRTPTFGTPTATEDGFTVQITNHNTGYTWVGTATALNEEYHLVVAINSMGLVTVTNAAPATSATATITTTRNGYATSSASITVTLPSYGLNFASSSNGAVIPSTLVGGFLYADSYYTGPFVRNYEVNCAVSFSANGALCTGSLSNVNSVNTSLRSIKNASIGSTWANSPDQYKRNALSPVRVVIDLGEIRTFNMARYYQMFLDGKTTHVALDISSDGSLQQWLKGSWTQVHAYTILDNSETSNGIGVVFPITTARYLRLRLYNDGRYGLPDWVALYNFKLFFTPT